ncbi:hypothetical protein ScFU149_09970 [Streptococcus canis]|nr:hypothetical protein ScOT1_11820 [Streptococcus canis]GFE45195.1 hypothetical protein ScFU6_09640 [Streptococcus canis]GFK30881.1 hypothetical protein ScFU149_09970 [Streptococcus canis]
MCKEQGHRLLPLPPYSPEYHFIEKIRTHIKNTSAKYCQNDTFLSHFCLAPVSVDYSKHNLETDERCKSDLVIRLDIKKTLLLYLKRQGFELQEISRDRSLLSDFTPEGYGFYQAGIFWPIQ